MSNLTNPPGGGEPPDRYRNVGEQIQAFFDFAENNPDRAVPFFVNIWETQASLTTRALALQGLGVAAKHDRVKEAFADWEVLKDIAKEVKGKGEVSNDLTRWAAALALEAIGYSQQSLQNLQGGGFTEPLDRIRREIRDRKLAEINRIQRINSRGETTAEYQRNLEFWLYGPVEELFAGNDHSPNYQQLVKDVIRELHGRGVYLGLISPNLLVQAEALLQAGSIFKESAEIENFLYPFLEDFLHNPNQEISFRINAAEIIHTARDLSRRLKTLSKLLLEERNTQLQEWTLGKIQSLFKQSAENEKFLYQPLEEFLLNSSREILLRINAAEIINTATDVSRRLKTFSKLLLEQTELRNAAVRLLTPYKQELARVDRDADTILDTLAFNYSLYKPELQNLTIAQIEAYISSTNQYQNKILSIFQSGINAAESLAERHRKSASILESFLQYHNNLYLSDIESWLQKSRNDIDQIYALRSKLDSNYCLLKEVVTKQGTQILDLDVSIYPTFLNLTRDIYNQFERWNKAECQTKNQCQTLTHELKLVKDKLKDALISMRSALMKIKTSQIYLFVFMLSILIALLFEAYCLAPYKGMGEGVSLSEFVTILSVTLFILLTPTIVVLTWRHKTEQKIMYVLKSLTNNWQE